MTLIQFRRSAAAASLFFFAMGTGACDAQAEEFKIGGTGAGLGTMRLLAAAYVKRGPGVSIAVLPSIGTSGGIKALLVGAIQLAVTTRGLKTDEATTGASQVEYGRTPFVFATSVATFASTGAAGVTTQDLAEIYAGIREQWSDGNRARVVLRPVSDYDTDLIKSMSPAMRDAHLVAEQRKGMPFAVTDQEAADSIEQIPGAIGPTSLALIMSENRRLKALALDGVIPSPASIADGSYRLVKTMYLIVGPAPAPVVQDFVKFVQSPAGREILTQNGHWVE